VADEKPSIQPEMTILDVVSRYGQTETVFRPYDSKAGVGLCCEALFHHTPMNRDGVSWLEGVSIVHLIPIEIGPRHTAADDVRGISRKQTLHPAHSKLAVSHHLSVDALSHIVLVGVFRGIAPLSQAKFTISASVAVLVLVTPFSSV